MTFYVLTTALTVSVDSFIAGFTLCVSKKKTLFLPIIVAIVTYAMCTVTALLGIVLKNYLETSAKYVGAGIMACLGVAALFKTEEEGLKQLSVAQCYLVGLSVGIDGAAASLSLILQGGNAITIPLLFALTHFLTVWLGQKLAQSAQAQKTNIFSAVTFFALAALKLMQ